jgi:hypothetical protein
MALLWGYGAEGRSVVSDAITVVTAGSKLSWNTGVPTDSQGGRSLALGSNSRQYIDLLGLQGPVPLVLQWRQRVASNAASATASRVGFGKLASGYEQLTVSRTAAGLWTLLIDGVVAATSGVAAATGSFVTMKLAVEGWGDGDAITVYVDDVLVITYVLNALQAVLIADGAETVFFAGQSAGTNMRIDDMVLFDYSDGLDAYDGATIAAIATTGESVVDPWVNTTGGDYTDLAPPYALVDPVILDGTVGVSETLRVATDKTEVPGYRIVGVLVNTYLTTFGDSGTVDAVFYWLLEGGGSGISVGDASTTILLNTPSEPWTWAIWADTEVGIERFDNGDDFGASWLGFYSQLILVPGSDPGEGGGDDAQQPNILPVGLLETDILPTDLMPTSLA